MLLRRGGSVGLVLGGRGVAVPRTVGIRLVSSAHVAGQVMCCGAAPDRVLTSTSKHG
jgi:hypothetical protein